MSTLERAIEIATKAHAGQTDKSGQDYIAHPLRVMLSLPYTAVRIIGVLHDVVEDTPLTLDDLRAEGFDEYIVEAIDAVTRRENETYRDFIERVRNNSLATMVKIADIRDNLRPGCPPGLVRRYAKALSRLV